MKLKSLLTFCCTVALTLTVNAKVWTSGDTYSNSKGTYNVTGKNILPNPYFEDGLTGWTSSAKKDGVNQPLTDSKFEILKNQDGITGNVLKALSNGGDGSEAAVQTSVELTPGKTYLISYLQKKGGDWSRTFLQPSPGTTTDGNEVTWVKNTEDWTEVTAICTATEANFWLVYNFSWLGSAAQFAEFFIGEAELDESVVNYDTLKETIANAQTSVEGLVIGDKNGNYYQSYYDALQDEIKKAQALIEGNEGTQTDVNAAVEAINTALEAFLNNKIFNYEENFEFETDVYYNFMMETGARFFSFGGAKDNGFLVMSDSFEYAANVKFIQPEGVDAGYYMVDNFGSYAYASGAWDAKYTSTAPATAGDVNYLWTLVEVDGHWVLHSMARKDTQYLASNDLVDGAKFYTDKGANSKGWFRIAKANVASVSYDKLVEAIENATNAVASMTIGTVTGNYPQEYYDNLMAAIEEGQELVDNNEGTQEEVNQAANLINDALAALRSNRIFNYEENFVLEEDVEYYFRMENGSRFLAYNWLDGNARLIMVDNFDQAAKVKFVQPEGVTEGYSMVTADGNYAYVAGNGWDAFYTSTPDANVTAAKYLWTIETIEGHNVIKCVGSKYLASDGLWDWAPFYADKPWNFKDGNGWFQIAKVDNGEDVAVEGVEVSTKAEKVYYDLNGRRVNDKNLIKGIYIVRQGNKTSKVVVK